MFSFGWDGAGGREAGKRNVHLVLWLLSGIQLQVTENYHFINRECFSTWRYSSFQSNAALGIWRSAEFRMYYLAWIHNWIFYSVKPTGACSVPSAVPSPSQRLQRWPLQSPATPLRSLGAAKSGPFNTSFSPSSLLWDLCGLCLLFVIWLTDRPLPPDASVCPTRLWPSWSLLGSVTLSPSASFIPPASCSGPGAPPEAQVSAPRFLCVFG